jgi:beta-lactamase superfamily II metal-dependent hydrolase
MTLGIPPATDELEISLFGPGVGECVVVHVGAGEWLVVDSCVDSATGRPAALDYLATLNVDVSRSVKLVAVTHWHDDHMRGASELVRQAIGAKFACSAVLRTNDVQTFVAASRTGIKADGGSGLDEFASILSTLQGRRHAGVRRETVGPTWSSADQLLFQRAGTAAVPMAQVYALSPSSATLSRGFHELARFMPKRGAPKRAAVSVDPNETSLVLSVQFGGAVAILGSDLENGSSPTTGWGAVLTTTARPATPAQIFKVPHHGSQNAYHQAVWTTALIPNVTAALTPFARGRQALPTSADIERMKQHTTDLHCTAPRPPRANNADPMVQKTIREVTKEFRPRTGIMGHVRVRASANTPEPRVERFGAAFAA